ncbi:negative regulator-MBF [Schizosaccharomyces cryophilus OY26]|uniref:Negative regulator-MBF n=1 Tax=Schizosaccharomyces cryophilus (strain OY26 / ATCC MYA-4695 / CBS 11777 / NBRC 106824 / NRRL Y48691) TaxID=653667 RepID=S9VY95_SCHCR|nr:negative regulator-MBF [Schizosaccharomyces cryophilus OY26]EPY52628.1 negative regulator-MBF [Schizosaccharomyces cryophilus OY26]
MDPFLKPSTPSRKQADGGNRAALVEINGQEDALHANLPVTPLQTAPGKENTAPGSVPSAVFRPHKDIFPLGEHKSPVSLRGVPKDYENEESHSVSSTKRSIFDHEANTDQDIETEEHLTKFAERSEHIHDIKACAEHLRLRLQLAMYKVKVNQPYSPLHDLPIIAKNKLHHLPNTPCITSVWKQKTIPFDRSPSPQLCEDSFCTVDSPTKSTPSNTRHTQLHSLFTPQSSGLDDLVAENQTPSPLKIHHHPLSKASSSHSLWARHGKLTRSVSLLNNPTPKRIRPRSLSKSYSTPLKAYKGLKKSPASNSFTGPPTPISITNTPENSSTCTSYKNQSLYNKTPIQTHAPKGRLSDFGMLR